LRTYT
jgi:hypothetical protein